MNAKGTLVIYPDVCWVTPKRFEELERNGFVYRFYNFVDNDDIEFVQALINWVRADSKTFDYWTASFIPNAG